MIQNLYLYKFDLDRIINGDTVYGNIDCGFGINYYIKVRFAGMNTPEIRGHQRPDGLVSKDALVSMTTGQTLFIKTFKDATCKYGRYIGELYTENELLQTNPVSINEQMVLKGYTTNKVYSP